jgi:uncharacterized protein with HEPN domain
MRRRCSSLQREARTYLYDIQQAAALVAQFTAGRTFDNYLDDIMLRSAVERQFEIIGEAMTQLFKLDAGLAIRISGYRDIIAFRNILIHGYAGINHRLVWGVVETGLPVLRREVDGLLAEP